MPGLQSGVGKKRNNSINLKTSKKWDPVNKGKKLGICIKLKIRKYQTSKNLNFLDFDYWIGLEFNKSVNIIYPEPCLN
jgi:hypothetical protein